MEFLAELLRYMLETWGYRDTLTLVSVVVAGVAIVRLLGNLGVKARTQQTETAMMQQLILQVEQLQREKDAMQEQMQALLLADAKRDGSSAETIRQVQELQRELSEVKGQLERLRVLHEDAEARYRAELTARGELVEALKQRDELIIALRQRVAVLENELQLARKLLADCNMDTKPLTKPKL